jgi:hypothetical protein
MTRAPTDHTVGGAARSQTDTRGGTENDPALTPTRQHSRALERACLAAMVRAPREDRGAWWALYAALRRDRDHPRRVSR